MGVLGPITSPVKLRDFAVIDLEWVPGEELDVPINTEVEVEGIRDTFTISLPVGQRQTGPLQLRLAAYFDQVTEDSFDLGDTEPIRTDRYESFQTIRELLDALLVRENRDRWFYAHAGGLADMEFVLDELLSEIKKEFVADAVTKHTVSFPSDQERKKGITKHEAYLDGDGDSDLRIKASFSGSSAIIVHVTRGKASWHFVDSYWLLRDKLSNIGKAINLHKGDAPEAVAFLKSRFQKDKLDDLSQREIEAFFREAPMPVLTAYNRVDCEILWKAIAQFEQEILELGGQLQQTIASTGMNLFRRAYLKRDIYTSERINVIAEQSYYASRVEVLSRDCFDFRMYDINSSFPYAMTFPLPAGLRNVQTYIPDDWLDMSAGETLPDDPREKNIFVADVTIEVPDMVLPPVPYRMENRVFFPVGKWRAWLTSTDIRLALREGCILHKVHEVYVFDSFYDLKGYADDIYAKRAAADSEFRRLVLKYLLNSLYGKYAESPFKQEMLINPEEVDRDVMQALQPGIWLKENVVAIAHRHVPVSTIITAIARRTLYDFAKLCYLQGLPFYYCDSIAADRTVVLKSPEGKIVVEPVEEVWNNRGLEPWPYRGGKETSAMPEGWMALAKDSSGKEGWFPLRKLIRHKTSKELFLISSKRGQVEVTGDHSLVVAGKEIKPADFLADNMQFETVQAPPSISVETVDLFEHVSDFRRYRQDGGESRLEADDANLRYINTREPIHFMQRYYRRGTESFRALLRVLAAYIAEGSSSLRGVTTTTRDMFSICQQSKPWLDGIHQDLNQITSGIQFVGPTWSEGSRVYYLRSGAGFLPCVFAALAGMRSSGKKLPSFIYALDRDDFLVFWTKLVEGDGWTDSEGQQFYTTISQQLAAGLSYLLSQHSMEHSIHYRPEKKSYMIRLRGSKERQRWTTLSETRRYEGYVYDLQVDGAHTFVDGLGRVLLHNTDSIATKADLPTDEKRLGALKLEKKLDWAQFIAPKIYRGEGFELKKGQWVPIQMTKAKGFSLGKSKEEAWDRFERIAGGDRIGIQRMIRLRELYRTGLQSPVDIMVVKALTFEMLSKRFHYPDGETRAWHLKELHSGDVYPRGFDFEPEVLESLDTTTRAMMAACV